MEAAEFFLSQCTDSWEQLKSLLLKELNGWKLTHPWKEFLRIMLKCWARVFLGQRNSGAGWCAAGRDSRDKAVLGSQFWRMGVWWR